MARKSKILLSHDKFLDRRKLGYYSTPQFIANYIFMRLKEINTWGNLVLDTCVGQEELLLPFLENNIKSVGMDIVQHKEIYQCEFYKRNFIDYYKDFKSGKDFSSLKFDYLIANPPYNCHEIEYISKNKKELQKLFPEIGVYNMYSMFLGAMIDMAKEGALLGLIIYDSFLTGKNHSELRKKILNNCIIHEIILSPTDLFSSQKADVRTVIIILEKRKAIKEYKVSVSKRPINTDKFKFNLKNRLHKKLPLNKILLNNSKDNLEFIIDIQPSIINLFNHKRIGDLFNCVTGISTGNDQKYLSPLITDKHSIPFFKNPGKHKFYCAENAYLINSYLEERKNIKNFIVRNIPLIGKEGITCSSMGVEFSACYLPKNTAFGVNSTIFCNNKSDIWWLLAYLNSDITKYILRNILIRGNMVTSGYVSRVPVLPFTDEEKKLLTKYAQNAYRKAKIGKTITDELNKINEVTFQHSKLKKSDINQISDFCKNIIKMT